MDTLLADFAPVSAPRRRRRLPLLALVALAAAIAVNAAIFAAVHAVLRRPLSFVDPDGLAWIAETTGPGGRRVRSPAPAPCPENRPKL